MLVKNTSFDAQSRDISHGCERYVYQMRLQSGLGFHYPNFLDPFSNALVYNYANIPQAGVALKV